MTRLPHDRLLFALLALSALPARAEAPRALFLGSSTTVGIGASRPERRWSTLLSRAMGWAEINEGTVGAYLTRPARGVDVPIAAEQLGRVGDARPDIVVVMYGANDAAERLPVVRTAAALQRLLSRLRATAPNAKLVVLTPQPNLATRDARAPYDEATRAAARHAGARFIDDGRAFTDEELDLFSADEVHLNDAGHARLASYLAGQLADLGVAVAARSAGQPSGTSQ